MKNTETKSINFRVSPDEKEHFESMARQIDENLTGLFRYELANHFLTIERNKVVEDLKGNTTSAENEQRDAHRAELLKQLFLNLRKSLRWYKNKMKSFQRELNRLEQMQKGFEQFEQKIKTMFDTEE